MRHIVALHAAQPRILRHPPITRAGRKGDYRVQPAVLVSLRNAAVGTLLFPKKDAAYAKKSHSIRCLKLRDIHIEGEIDVFVLNVT
jgi:hypothetical protein